MHNICIRKTHTSMHNIRRCDKIGINNKQMCYCLTLSFSSCQVMYLKVQCGSISVSSAETQSLFCHYSPMGFSLCESQLISVVVVVLDIETLR